MTEHSFRTMRQSDIEAGLQLCRASRWNQLRRDWEIFLKLGHDGCRVAVKDGRVIGTVATIRYEGHFSWIGMVLVDTAERGQGIGTQLMREALTILSDERSIRLDATPAGYEVYRKLDFNEEYRLSRMEALVSGVGPCDTNNPARPMTGEDLVNLRELDRRVFGADRGAMLDWMFEGAPEYAWVVADGGDIAGYMFGRHGFNFDHLGPIVAHDRQVARQLVQICLSRQVGRSFIIDACLHESDWQRWLESIGFREQRPFIRMYCRGNPFPGLPSQQFGVLGPEFG